MNDMDWEIVLQAILESEKAAKERDSLTAIDGMTDSTPTSDYNIVTQN